jgi:hypothetical protein
MQFIYVDESGDPGAHHADSATPCGSRHFILSSVAIPADRWFETLSVFARFRTEILARHSLPLWTELHAREVLYPSDSSPFKALRNRAARVGFLRELAAGIAANIPQLCIASVAIDKATLAAGLDLHDHAWSRLIRHCERRMQRLGPSTHGLLLADETNEKRLRWLVRSMRHGLPRPRGEALLRLIEDPVIRQSHHSFPIQIADLAAFTLYHYLWPKGALRRYGADRLYLELSPLLDPSTTSETAGVVEC